MLPGLHRGSRSETATETFCELLAGIGGHDLRWETASDQRRQFLHLVFAGAALRPARHSRMGTVADFAVGIAKADSASSWIWICRSSRQGQAESVIGAASENRRPATRGCTTHPHSEQFWEDCNPWPSYIQATAFVRRAEA